VACADGVMHAETELVCKLVVGESVANPYWPKEDCGPKEINFALHRIDGAARCERC
jgi:hypothetical protein